jgi:nitrogen fixation protein NifU and related proteins
MAGDVAGDEKRFTEWHHGTMVLWFFVSTSMNEEQLKQAIENPQNLGEMADADAVGTVGSPECGDMLRIWLKFSRKDGKKVIDRASFQSFGCQTALAVASLATEMLKGKTLDEAKSLSAGELSAPLGPLPPMKIHCGQMVEGALRAAIESEASGKADAETRDARRPAVSGNLAESLAAAPRPGKIKIVLKEK